MIRPSDSARPDWRRSVALLVVAGLLVSACGSSTAGSTPEGLDSVRIDEGRALYEQNCATCHGLDLEGDPNWRSRGEDGNYPPPPQDGSGHTWHHSDQLLVDIVLRGSGLANSGMPQYAGLLTEDQVLSILEYFKSTWEPEERAFQLEQTQRASISP